MSETQEQAGSLGAWFALMKPGVILLLQVTAICAVLAHDLIDWHVGAGLDVLATLQISLVVLVGGMLTAGGANAINMWYDRDIDPQMVRTATRPIPSGAVSETGALVFGVVLALLGTAWFWFMANPVAAFWAAFSVLFYVFVYTIWLKRRTPQNIVIGGIAGSTPPLIGWASAADGLTLADPFDLGAALPWLMFLLIFLWTPPHFWALALFRAKEYAQAGVPMMPTVHGSKHTMIEMRVYCLLLIGLSAAFVDPVMWGLTSAGAAWSDAWLITIIYSLWALMLGIWYNQSVLDIKLRERRDSKGRIPSAFRSFFISMKYLAMMFLSLVLVLASVQIAIVLLLVLLARESVRGLRTLRQRMHPRTASA
ncbi:MAG: protoheme IX farnesyltransferase [Methanobacteriota archaeon]|nr:MAG: protoheme IX farnesyltransferase [Euryarchaeota archaeon]